MLTQRIRGFQFPLMWAKSRSFHVFSCMWQPQLWIKRKKTKNFLSLEEKRCGNWFLRSYQIIFPQEKNQTGEFHTRKVSRMTKNVILESYMNSIVLNLCVANDLLGQKKRPKGDHKRSAFQNMAFLVFQHGVVQKALSSISLQGNLNMFCAICMATNQKRDDTDSPRQHQLAKRARA